MTENIVLANESLNKWCNTEGINYYEGIEALGLLFKYAVPRAQKEYGVISIEFGLDYCSLGFGFGLPHIVRTNKDPTLALFRAINQIIEQEGK